MKSNSNLLSSRQSSELDLTKAMTKHSYFSDINPKYMKRLVHIVAVTGRLLRAYGIEYNRLKLAGWIQTTEQWPYRLSWMILEVEDNPTECDDGLSLKALYDRSRDAPLLFHATGCVLNVICVCA